MLGADQGADWGAGVRGAAGHVGWRLWVQCAGGAVNCSQSVTWSVPKKPQRPDSWSTLGLPGWGVQAAELVGVSL